MATHFLGGPVFSLLNPNSDQKLHFYRIFFSIKIDGTNVDSYRFYMDSNFLFHSPNSDPRLCFLRDSTNEAQNHFYWRPNCQTFNQEMEFSFSLYGCPCECSGVYRGFFSAVLRAKLIKTSM